MLRVVGIAGYRKSGKTRTVEGLVKELVNRGYRVGTVKHVHKSGFTLDQPGKDTWRHARAGSEKIACLSPRELAVIEKRESQLEEVLLSMLDFDFVVLEGFRKSEGFAKIMVARSLEEALDLDDEFTIAFVGNGVEGKPVLGPGEFDSLANLVEERAIPPLGGLDCCGECGYDSCLDFALAALDGEAPKNGCKAIRGGIKLSVDGQRIPLNFFLQGLISSTLAGMISSLRGGKGKKIEIEVTRSEG